MRSSSLVATDLGAHLRPGLERRAIKSLKSSKFFDAFREPAYGRLRAFEGMYMRLIREAGGLERFLGGATFHRVEEIVEKLTGPEGRRSEEHTSELQSR